MTTPFTPITKLPLPLPINLFPGTPKEVLLSLYRTLNQLSSHGSGAAKGGLDMGATAGLALGQGLGGLGQTAGPADFYGVMTAAEETDLCDAIRFVSN